MIPATGSCEGKMRESHRIMQERTGNRWKMETVFRPEYCFHKITAIFRNRPFPGRTVRPGSSNNAYDYSSDGPGTTGSTPFTSKTNSPSTTVESHLPVPSYDSHTNCRLNNDKATSELPLTTNSSPEFALCKYIPFVESSQMDLGIADDDLEELEVTSFELPIVKQLALNKNEASVTFISLFRYVSYLKGWSIIKNPRTMITTVVTVKNRRVYCRLRSFTIR